MVGQGLTERQAAEVTFNEYLLRLKAEEKRMIERWEIARWQSFVACRVAGAKSIKRPQDLLKLPTDIKRAEAIPISDEDIEALRKIGLIQD